MIWLVASWMSGILGLLCFSWVLLGRGGRALEPVRKAPQQRQATLTQRLRKAKSPLFARLLPLMQHDTLRATFRGAIMIGGVVALIAAGILLWRTSTPPSLIWWLMTLMQVGSLGLVVTLLILRRALRKRHGQLVEQVPDVLGMIVRALRVGQPMASVIRIVGQETRQPLAGEFALAADHIAYGTTLSDALAALALRCESRDLQFFAAAVSVQASTGGNLAEVLERLSDIARGRLQFRRRVQAITAEARWSARFLSAFPLIAIAGMLMVSPSYFDDVFDQPWFGAMVLVVAGLLVVNLVVLQILLNLE